MTSQPEAALTEAQAAYEAAKAERLERSTVSNEAWRIALNFERLSAERLIALQAARIQELETEATQLKAEVRRSGLMPEFYESCQQLLAKLEGEDAAIFDALLMAHGVSASESRRLYANVAELMGIEEHMVAPSGIALYEQLMESWLPVHDREVSTARIASLEAEVAAAVDSADKARKLNRQLMELLPNGVATPADAIMDDTTIYDYNRHGIIALKIPALPTEIFKAWADQRRVFRVAFYAYPQAPADAESGVTA